MFEIFRWILFPKRNFLEKVLFLPPLPNFEVRCASLCYHPGALFLFSSTTQLSLLKCETRSRKRFPIQWPASFVLEIGSVSNLSRQSSCKNTKVDMLSTWAPAGGGGVRLPPPHAKPKKLLKTNGVIFHSSIKWQRSAKMGEKMDKKSIFHWDFYTM